MRYNPCGRLVDWRRVPYSGKVKVFRDSEETAGVFWYPANKGAEKFNRTSCVTVLDWDDRAFDYADGTGQWVEWNTFREERERVGALGAHVCGTDEDFAKGGKYEPDEPPVKYGANGLPACCAPAVVGVGGMVIGGAGDVAFIPRPVARGGLVLGGRGDVVYYPPGPPPGVACTDAPLIPLDAEVASAATATSDDWWKFTADGSHSYSVVLSGATDADEQLSAWTGTCPGALVPLPPAHSPGSDTWVLTTPPAGLVWVEWTSLGFVGDYSFHVHQL